ncbi:MAG TPA: choice-of-anchor J domain-containing protein, partial [Bacteroidales bacterium]|nr:choice-of-anchor J domain-containing protein [Bacteroidales bacterium]
MLANLSFGQVQINEGFEGLVFPSTGWVESGNGDWSKQSSAAGYPVHSGSFAAYCNGAGSYLVSPAITVNPADIFTFWYRVESNSVPQEMDILISTSPLTFNDTLLSLDGVTNIAYTKVTLSLAAYSGQTVYIAFVGQSGGGAIFDYGILLDDVLLFGLPVCSAPLSPANGATNVPLTAGLSWTAASAADGYVLNFGTNYPPNNLENGTDLGSAMAYSPASLNYGTTYYWQVLPYNVNGSPSCSIWSFTTGADPVIHSFPWTETFSAWPPAGWNMSGGSLSWAPYGSTAAYCNFWNWPVGNAMMTTPPLDLSQDATLRFNWSHAYLPGFSDHFEVQISESGSGVWTSLWSLSGAALHSADGATNIAPGSYVQQSVLIPVAYTGKTVNLRFIGTSGNGNDLFLDQVMVEYDPFLSVSVDPLDLCYGETGNLEAVARGGQKPYLFAWNPVSGLANPAAALTAANPATTTAYTVTVTDAASATASATAIATVNPMLSVTAQYSTTVCTNNLTQLYAVATGGTPPYTYSWDHAATLSNAAISDPFSFANSTTTYTVTVTDAAGCQSLGQVTVTTGSAPMAHIYPLNPEICAGESIRLTATGGVTYSWTSIPAGFTSSAASPVVTPAATMQYVVQVGSACGNRKDTVTVVVHPLPVVSFGPVVALCVDAAAVALSTGNPAGGVYSGPGVSGGIFDPSVAGAGNHVLSYTYTDLNGCSNTATRTVTVNPLPVVSFAGLSTDYCVSQAPSALFGVPAGGTFNGPGILPGDLFDPAVAGVGSHVIMYAYTDVNGCTNFLTKGVEVHALPVLSITGLNASYCLTDPVGTIYGSEAPNGSFSGPGIIDLGNGTATFNPVMAWIGTHTVTYTYTDLNGCSNAVSQTVTVYPLPNVSFAGLALTYCGNAPAVTLVGNQAPFGTFTGHGITNLGNGTATFDPSVAVTYPAFLNRHEIKYSYTSPGGCTNVASIFVTVHYVPTVNAGANQTICLGNVAQLNAIPGGGTPPYGYAWNNAGSLSNALIRNPIASPLVTTNYTVTITDFNGCQNTDEVLITVNDPVATVADDTTCLNTPIALNVIPSGGSAPYTYIWSPAASLNNPFIQQPIANPLVPGDHVYTVTITDAIGCFGTGSLTLTVLPIPALFSVTGGGDYCAGGPGVPVGLSGSEAGITYELYADGAATGNIVAGTGSAISFGNILIAGTYTVLATHSNG